MIDKTAIIDSKAKLDKNVQVGPYCVIGPNVEIGENTVIQSHVNISGNVKIGKENKIYPFVSINDPQDSKYNGEPTNLIIGDNNKIREYVTINPGTVGGGGKTVIGNNCLFMISSHIAHDCYVGNNVIIANNVPLGGHAIIEDNVVIGGNSAVQQFTRIGKMAMIGGMTGVLHDVIPYGLSTGNRNSLQGLNLIGLRRAKFENKDILGLSEAYKEIFATKKLTENLAKLNGSFKNNPLVKEVQLQNLGCKLNSALAQVAAKERKSREILESELDSALAQVAAQERIRRNLENRIGELNQRLLKASQRPKLRQVEQKPPRTSPSNQDVIKFP